MVEEEKKIIFRRNAKHLFVTYPQWSVEAPNLGDLEVLFLDQAWYKDYGCIEYVIAREMHDVQGWHLHCYFHFEKKLNIINQNYMDVAGHHGHIETCRSVNAVLKYCIEDGSYISNFDVRKFISLNKQIKSDKLVEVLKKKLPLSEYIALYPTDILNYKKLKENTSLLWEDNMLKTKIDYPELIYNPWKDVVLDLNWKSKQKHIWIWSAVPNRGKTTWLKELCMDYHAYFLNRKDNFQIFSDKVQFILIDDYNDLNGNISISHLNNMCDGVALYNRKFLVAIRPDPVVIIICANCSPNMHYDQDIALFNARFRTFEIK